MTVFAKWISATIATAFVVIAVVAQAQPMKFQEGQQYQRLAKPMRTASDNTKEVAEMFSYRCPACFSFEPTVKAWLQSKPDDVAFVRIPVGFGRASWDLMARAYYAAEELGVAEKMDEPIFDAIHVQNRALADVDEVAELFAENGISKDDFLKAFKSFSVETKMRKGVELLRRYQVRSVPMLVVNGEFAITGKTAGTARGMFEIADYLLQ